MDYRDDTVVFKAGGSVLNEADDFAAEARELVAKQHSGVRVAVVLSAMKGWTNQFRGLCTRMHPEALRSEELRPHADLAVASAEMVSTGMMALAIHRAGGCAASFASHQIGLRTTGAPGRALIEQIEGIDRIEAALEEGTIPCVAGYQVVDPQGRILTLDRGGTDLSAVAIAYGLRAQECVLLKDVAGVGAAPPRIVSGARIFERLSYSQMRRCRSQVVMDEAVALAERHLVRIRVRLAQSAPWSADTPRPEGTLIGLPDLLPGRLAPPEEPLVCLRVRENLTRIEISEAEIPPDLLLSVSEGAENAKINLIQVRASNHDCVIFVEEQDQERMLEVVRTVLSSAPVVEDGYATITLVDERMLDEVGYMARLTRALYKLREAGVDGRNVWGVDDLLMPIVPQAQLSLVAQTLAEEFGLLQEE